MPDRSVNPGWFTALGAVMIIVGFVAIGSPFAFTLAANFLVGWILVFTGVAELAHAFSCQGWKGFLWELLIGVLTAGVGLMLVFYPLAGAVTLTLVLAIWFILGGIMKLIMGFQLRPAPGSGLIILGGALGLLLGVMIYSEWPSSAVWVIGTLVGINLIFDGWGMIGHAAAVKVVESAGAESGAAEEPAPAAPEAPAPETPPAADPAAAPEVSVAPPAAAATAPEDSVAPPAAAAAAPEDSVAPPAAAAAAPEDSTSGGEASGEGGDGEPRA